MGIFHAYDIRGIYNVEWNKEMAYKIAYFIPSLLKTTKVLVGRDMRVSSDEIHDAVLNALTDAGADVYDIGMSTTPEVYFATAKFNFNASIQITASHNPKEYNGMKVSTENALPVGLASGLGTIKEWIEEDRPTPVAEKRGTVHEMDIKEEYLAFIRSFKENHGSLKIAVDASNGMASIFVHQLFGESPIYLYDTPDGTFPNHEANPQIPENIIDLQKTVIENKCDVGVIFDGDADRVMFVDETGRFVSPDLIIALLGKHFLVKKGLKGKILQDIRSSKSVSEYLTPLGGEIHTWKVGRANAAPKLREIDGIFGGELAGHYYFKDFFYSDSGLLAAVLVLNILADLKRKNVTFSAVIDEISNYYNSGEVNFRIDRKDEAIEAVKDYFTSQEEPAAIFDFDGYRVEFPQWWFNVRSSNTEPLLRFICEANSLDQLDSKMKQAREIIEQFK